MHVQGLVIYWEIPITYHSLTQSGGERKREKYSEGRCTRLAETALYFERTHHAKRKCGVTLLTKLLISITSDLNHLTEEVLENSQNNSVC